MEERGCQGGWSKRRLKKEVLDALAQDKPTEEAFCGISWARRDKNKSVVTNFASMEL